jgi:endoglucanase
LLLGLVMLLAGCDGGAVFDLDPPDDAAGQPVPEEVVDGGGGEADVEEGAQDPDDAPGTDTGGEAPPAAEDSDEGGQEPAAPGTDTGGEAPPAAEDSDEGGQEPAAPGAAAGDILAGTDGFFVPPTQAAEWVAANAGDPRATVIGERIADVPSSVWFTGSDGVGGAVDAAVTAAAAANTVPVLVAYNVPGRDCGQYSAGGADGSDAYRAWVDEFAGAVGDRPAIVILEPDALAGMDCLSDDLQQDRVGLLRYAVEQFAAQAPNAWTYLDAGHAAWQPAGDMAGRLDAAAVAAARGFALNVSNYHTTADNEAYGADVNAALGSAKPFVVDTSRNGNGSNGEWCNPGGRAIGVEPNVHTIGEGLEMELWVKLPGESDGDCGIGPGTSAGQFVPDIAFALAGA